MKRTICKIARACLCPNSRGGRLIFGLALIGAASAPRVAWSQSQWMNGSGGAIYYNGGNVGSQRPAQRNVPLSVTVSSATLVLTDASGAPFSTSAMTFQALPTDVGVSPPLLASMFPPPDAKMIHVYVAALR